MPADIFNTAGPVPHRCPVCLGSQSVPAGFYGMTQTTNANPEPCRTCDGTGIVWR